MKSSFTKLAAAAAIIIATVIGIVLFEKSSKPAWAIEESMKALDRFNSIYLTGSDFHNGVQRRLELWARPNANKSQSQQLIMKFEDGSVTWVKDKEIDTYRYDSNSNTVKVVRGNKASLSPWFGAKMLNDLQQETQNFQISYGVDSDTGRERAFVKCCHAAAPTPKSWCLEFDVESKLLVRLKQWEGTMKWEGHPVLEIDRIVYYNDDLDEKTFEFEPPKDAKITFTENPIFHDPNFGMLIENRSETDAAKQIVEKFWAAVVEKKLDEVKRLWPILTQVGDQSAIESSLGITDGIKGVEQIGTPYKTANEDNYLIVPCTLSFPTGTEKVELIILFRNNNGVKSCVILNAAKK